MSGTEVGAAKPRLFGYGLGPVAAAGVATLGLGIALAIGGAGMAEAMTNQQAQIQAADQGKSSGSQTPGGENTPGGDDPSTSPSDPSTTPDRDSDQGESPKGDSQPQAPREDVVYVIQWGDTLTSISRTYGVSVDRLAEYNGIRDVNLIYADSAMLIPYSQIKIPPQE